MSANRVFAPLMAVAALGLSSAAVMPVSAVASGSQIITCQKHGGKASLAHGGKCKSGETKTAWQSAVPSPKTSAIYTCKSGSGSERLVSRSTKCAKHERKLTWYQVKPANGQSKSGTLGTTTVTPPTAPVPPPALPAIIPSGPESTTPAAAPNFEVAAEQRVKGQSAYTKTTVIAEAGETLEYQIVVTNTGNTNLTVSVPKAECTNVQPAGEQPVGVGATATYTCTHKAHPSDVPSYVNVADVASAGKEKASNELTATVGESKELTRLKKALAEAEAKTVAAGVALGVARNTGKPLIEAEAALAKAKEAEATAENADQQAKAALTKAKAEVEKAAEEVGIAVAEGEKALEAEETAANNLEALEEELPQDKNELKEEKAELEEVEHEYLPELHKAEQKHTAAEKALQRDKEKLVKAEAELVKHPTDQKWKEEVATDLALVETEEEEVEFWEEEAREDKEEIEFYESFVLEDIEIIKTAEENIQREIQAVKTAHGNIGLAEKHQKEAQAAEAAALAKVPTAEAVLTQADKAEAEAKAATKAAEEKLEEVIKADPSAKPAIEQAEEGLSKAVAAETSAAQAVKAEEVALASA